MNSTATKKNIRTWKQFARYVRPDNNLLVSLDQFPNSILVAGCQRSGTTMLARIFTKSDGMINYWFGEDDELDAALILSGHVDHECQGRYCFQTTYLNERYPEYFNHSGYKLIWVLRNPFSVVYSLLYHWKRFAFNELFQNCGYQLLDAALQRKYDTFGNWGVKRLTRACMSYNGKTSQVFEIYEKLGPENMMIVDYDELVSHKETILPTIYEFVGLPFQDKYTGYINVASINKAKRLSEKERITIEELCIPVYEKARKLII